MSAESWGAGRGADKINQHPYQHPKTPFFQHPPAPCQHPCDLHQHPPAPCQHPFPQGSVSTPRHPLKGVPGGAGSRTALGGCQKKTISVDRSRLYLPRLHPDISSADRVAVFELVLRGLIFEAHELAAELEHERLARPTMIRPIPVPPEPQFEKVWPTELHPLLLSVVEGDSCVCTCCQALYTPITYSRQGLELDAARARLEAGLCGEGCRRVRENEGSRERKARARAAARARREAAA